METVTPPPEDYELHLLTEWGEPGDGPRRRKAAILSFVIHLVFILVLSLVSERLFAPAAFQDQLSFVTPLIFPLTHLTQKDPNTNKLSKEFDVAASVPRPRVQLPGGAVGPPPVRQFHPTETPKPLAPLPEPPKVETPVIHTDLPAIVQPQIQAVARPPAQSPFENPPTQPAYDPGKGLPLPKATDAIHGVPAGRGEGGSGVAANQSASPSAQDSSMLLLSDPKGVDFKPFIAAVQARVNHFWQSMLPGIRVSSSGRVSVKITIDQSGRVSNVSYALPSGLTALDRAAIAAISASTPLPPFPKGFNDPTVSLQINFSYNVSR